MLVRILSNIRVYFVIFGLLAFVILFRTRTVFYEGWPGVREIIPSLVAAVMLGCLTAQLGPGQAGERERESGQSQYYNLLQSLLVQPAARQQPHSTQQ